MDRDTIIDRMVEIEKALMHLANNCGQGNAVLFDAILAAQIALYDATHKEKTQ